MGSGTATGYALVDFLKLQHGAGIETNWLISKLIQGEKRLGQLCREHNLAESLVRAPNGGAIAVWASSSLTSSASQVAMDRELFRLLFTGAYPTLGEAIAAAKKATSDIDVRRSWNLLGDPATHLKGLVPRTFTNTSTRAKDLAEARRFVH